MRERIKIILCGLSVLLIGNIYAQTGSITGKVLEKSTGEGLIGATVAIEGTTKGAITDFEGNYALNNIEPGTYTVLFSFVSFTSQRQTEIEVKAGEATIVNVTMEESTTALDEVQVVGRASRESEAMQLINQKNATIIKESIGAQQLSSMGVSDAAAATTKISGVTKTEGTGDIYVRGLGDRYLSTTMNGLPVPPDDIDKKNINLNLFSTDVLSNISVSKTYSIDNYGDLTSGNIDIVTKRLSGDSKLEIGIDGGVNTGVLKNGVFDNFKATQNANDISTLGFYKKPYELEESLNGQSWNTSTKSLPVNYGYSFIAGKKFMVLGSPLSVLLTASQTSSSEYRDGIYQKFRMNNLNKSFTDVEYFNTSVNTTGLFNINYNINPNHSISYNLLYIHKITDILYEMGRNKIGYIRDFEPNEDGGVFVRDQNTKATQLIINQMIGNHSLGEKNNLKWAFGYNIVNADEPNRFRNEASYNTDLEAWQFGHVSNFHNKKSYQEIKDNEINGDITNVTDFINKDKTKLNLTVGTNFRIKNREFVSNYMGVEAIPSMVNFTSIDNMDEALLDQELYTDEGLVIDNSIPVDYFDATLSAYAGFLKIGFELKNLSGTIGLRYEADKLEANWDVANYVGRTGSRSNTYNNLLPALNLKYQVTEKSAIRLAASKTITLPEFKEISPFEYVSPDGDVIKGNSELEHSVNYNADLKWELYPSAKELISVTSFYKIINDPINLALTRGSSGYLKYDNTGNQAKIYGLEFETRYGIIKSSKGPGLNLVLNATKMWFEQDLLEYFQYSDITKSGLEGASEFIINGSLNFNNNNKENKFEATLTANYSSDKIYALGAPESQGDKLTLFNSDIIEKGFVTVDMVISKQISKRVTIKLKAKNLLNPEVQQTQHIQYLASDPKTEVVRSFKKGINLGLGLKIMLD